MNRQSYLFIQTAITFSALLLCCRALPAGTLTGRILDADTGRGVSRTVIRAFAHGRSVAVTAQSEVDGSYTLADLPPGRYAICLPPGNTCQPVSVPDVEVPAGAPALLNLKVTRSLFIDGDSWVQPYPSFAQSFVATGLGITAVAVKGFGPGRRVTVQVLAGQGPTGPRVGPPRITAPVGGESTEPVSWSGGEVPTLPGQVFTLLLTAGAGEKWVAGLAGRGDVYAGGSAWFDSSPRPHSDLGIVVSEDNSGLRTDYAMSAGWRTWRLRAVGQTFTALSRAITFASAVLSGVHGPPVYVRFSIHEEGPGGRQIGPSKVVQVTEDAAVAWGPDEVPTKPGQTLYLHIESLSGEIFLAAVQPACFAGGQAFFEAAPAQDWELCATVAGQIGDADFARLVGQDGGAPIKMVNPSFETGMEGWQSDGPCGAVVGCDAGVTPMWGTRMFGWTNTDKGEGSRSFVYQPVKVTKGLRYRFSGSVYTDHEGGRSSDVKVRLTVLPDGGTQWRDNDRIETSQWYATEGQWRRASVEFTAAADPVIVGFDLEQRWNLPSSSLYADGAYLEEVVAQ
ncbi:MAG: carboxypeptidase regulatory-like domain-containing protein [Phycisphaerae bacterium]